MFLVLIYSGLLIFGMVVAQLINLETLHPALTFLTDICLGYIMMEVGFEFIIYKKRWKMYIKDYFVAVGAATIPWLLCFGYFMLYFDSPWSLSLLVARFAAPTSSGILFSMLAAAGLATTWVFRKVEILAILDDIDTVLLLIPLQFLFAGPHYAQLIVVLIVIALVYLTWRYLHQLHFPYGRVWLLGYSFVLAIVCWASYRFLGVELEILLPAFAWGCILFNPHDPRRPDLHVREHEYLEPERRPLIVLDRAIKLAFMLLVGLILPKVHFETLNLKITALHVVMITALMMVGKLFPSFFYKKDATGKERTALGFGMFPRGEVGAGILVLAVEHGVSGYVLTVASLSLALNFLLTGPFLTLVIHLVKRTHRGLT